MQVTKDTVDVGIYQLAQRKLKLDLAVLGGNHDGKAKASEAGAMKDILTALLDTQPAASEGSDAPPVAAAARQFAGHSSVNARPTPVTCIEID